MSTLTIVGQNGAFPEPGKLERALATHAHQLAVTRSYLTQVLDSLNESPFNPEITERLRRALTACREKIEVAGEPHASGEFNTSLADDPKLIKAIRHATHPVSNLRSIVEKTGSWFMRLATSTDGRPEFAPDSSQLLSPEELEQYKAVNQKVLLMEMLLGVSAPQALPPILVLDPSSHCNYRCSHCHQSSNQDFYHTHLSRQVLEKIEPALIGVEQAKLFGTGEATLAPILPLLIEVTGRNGCRTEVQTNGSTLDNLNINLAEVDLLGISFDGANKRTFEALRKGANFNALVKRIRQLKEQYPKLEMYFAVTISRANIDEIVDIIRLACSLSIERVFLNKIIPYMERLKPLALRRSDVTLLMSQVAEAKLIADEHGLILNNCITLDNEEDDQVPLEKEKIFEYLDQLSVEKNYRKTPIEDLLTVLEQMANSSFELPEEARKLLLSGSQTLSTPKRVATILNYRELVARYDNLLALVRRIPPADLRLPYCTSPWVKFFVEAHGGVRPCDPWGTDITSLNNHDTFTDAWHADELVRLRRATVGDGAVPMKCRGCTFAEKHLYIDEVIDILRQNEIDIKQITLPKIVDSVKLMNAAHRGDRSALDTPARQVEELEERIKGKDFAPINLERVHAQVIDLLANNRVAEAWELAAPLMREGFSNDQKHDLRLRFIMPLFHQGMFLESQQMAIELFLYQRSCNFAEVVFFSHLRENQKQNNPAVIPISPDRHFQFTLDHIRQRSPEAVQEWFNYYPLCSEAEIAGYQYGALSRYKSEYSQPPSLNASHYVIRSMVSQRFIPPVRYFAIPQAQVYEEAEHFAVIDGNGRTFPPVTSRLCGVNLAEHRAKHLQGTSALIADFRPARNYSHWIYDTLARIILLEMGTSEPIDHWIAGTTSEPFHLESLALMGIPSDRVESLEENPYLSTDRLICTSDSGFSVQHPVRWGWAPLIHLLRNRIFAALQLPRSFESRRLFISRGDAKARGGSLRTFHGEDACFEALRDQLGFEKVLLSEMSFAEQVRIFAQAEAVVGAHGAGLTNLIFSRPGTVVNEIFNVNYGTAAYAMISQRLRHDYSYLCCEPAGRGPVSNHSIEYHRPELGHQSFEITDREIAALVGSMRSRLDKGGILPVRSKQVQIDIHQRVKPNGDHVCSYDGITAQQKPGALSFITSFINSNGIPRVVEIGTGYGGLTKALIDHTDAQVLTIDIVDIAPHLADYSPRLERILGDSLDARVIDRVADRTQGTPCLFLIDGGNKIAEFNRYRSLLKAGDFVFVHDFAPSEREFLELKAANVWLWHESDETQLHLAGLKRLENFNGIWRSFVWGVYQCLETLAPDPLPLDLTVTSDVQGDILSAQNISDITTRNDLRLLYQLGEGLPEGGRCLEVGPFTGLSTLFLARGAQDSGNSECQIYCIDSWSGYTPECEKLGLNPADLQFHFLDNIERTRIDRVVTALKITGEKALSMFPDEFFDLVIMNRGELAGDGPVEKNPWLRKLKASGRLYFRAQGMPQKELIEYGTVVSAPGTAGANAQAKGVSLPN